MFLGQALNFAKASANFVHNDQRKLPDLAKRQADHCKIKKSHDS